jgi:hypothetical protein
MNNSKVFKNLNKILVNCNVFIIYKHLPGEIDYTTIPFIKNQSKKILILPNAKNSDPYVWVENCKKLCGKKKVCVLIPGLKFDKQGTRHGRGGGWYDRFLANIPKECIRIGITHSSKLSISPLNRESWDEPMDWIIVDDNSNWKIFETKARNI